MWFLALLGISVTIGSVTRIQEYGANRVDGFSSFISMCTWDHKQFDVYYDDEYHGNQEITCHLKHLVAYRKLEPTVSMFDTNSIFLVHKGNVAVNKV